MSCALAGTRTLTLQTKGFDLSETLCSHCVAPRN